MNGIPTTDFGPAVERLATLVLAVRDDQLDGPTPCPDWTVGDLIDHIGGLALAFAAGARKDLGELTGAGPDPSAKNLTDGWRGRTVQQLDALARAWQDPSAWTGTTEVGGVTSPAPMVAGFCLNEVVVHGWDLARACGQPYEVDRRTLPVAWQFAVETTDPAGGPQDNALFGSPRNLPEDAPPLDRLVGLRGRDPQWTPEQP